MIRSSSIVLSLLTFPGVIIHVLIQQLVCRLCQVPIFELTYFNFAGVTPGYIKYESPNSTWVRLLICAAPLLGNSGLGFLIAAPASFTARLGSSENASLPYLVLNYGLAWLGVCIATHAFPSITSAMDLWDAIKKPGQSALLMLVGYPVAAFSIFLADISIVWANLAFGVFIGIFFPDLIIRLFV